MKELELNEWILISHMCFSIVEQSLNRQQLASQIHMNMDQRISNANARQQKVRF